MAGGGLSPALCEYNEQAATVRTPARDKKIDSRSVRSPLDHPAGVRQFDKASVADARTGEGEEEAFQEDRRRGARYGRFLKTPVSIAYADQADS